MLLGPSPPPAVFMKGTEEMRGNCRLSCKLCRPCQARWGGAWLCAGGTGGQAAVVAAAAAAALQAHRPPAAARVQAGDVLCERDNARTLPARERQALAAAQGAAEQQGAAATA